jgi:hypothetical protein
MRKEIKLSRRQFIAKSTILAAASIVPRYVLGGSRHISPSDQLNVAVIGTGGQGITNIKNLRRLRARDEGNRRALSPDRI